jgi:hypothetical protein
VQQNAALVKVSPIGYCGAPRFHKRQMSRFFAVIVFAVAGAHLPSSLLAQTQVPPLLPDVHEHEILQLLPEHAVITGRLNVGFENGIRPDAEAVAFTLPPVYAETYSAGLRVLGRSGDSERRVLYMENFEFEPHEDELTLEKVTAQSGAEALVVINHHSGAGTVTDWKIVMAQGGKLRSMDVRPIRDRVLKQRYSTFGGYNVIKIQGDIIAETIPMYSEHTARCCLDRAPIEMRVRFTGKSLKLDSVIELPPHNR